jgi:hypothetical protein
MVELQTCGCLRYYVMRTMASLGLLSAEIIRWELAQIYVKHFTGVEENTNDP